MWETLIKYSAKLRNWWIGVKSWRHRSNIKKSKNLLKLLAGIKHEGARINYLRKIDPYVFEELVLSIFECHGYVVWRTGSYSGDGGFDGKVYIEKKGWYLVQSKRYGAHIKAQHAKEFVQLVNKNAKGGFFVHSGKTSEELRIWLRSTRVKVLSGSVLVNSIENPKVLEQWLRQ